MDETQQMPLGHTECSSRVKSHPDCSSPFLSRDGLLDFAPGDSSKPLNWSNKRKYGITGVSILLVVNATFASSAPTGAFQGISKDLNVSNEVAGLVTTLFLLGYYTGPLIWVPLSEYYGQVVSTQSLLTRLPALMSFSQATLGLLYYFQPLPKLQLPLRLHIRLRRPHHRSVFFWHIRRLRTIQRSRFHCRHMGPS